jgi:anaerobic selenocysteine-containing dehydrogenase
MRTTCPLDCYDACSVIYEDSKLKGDPSHPITDGYLCPNLNSFLDTKRLQHPTFNGAKISMDEALEILVSELKKVRDKKSIYFKGQGNFGLMQNITGEFFREFGSTFTRGSLCDSAGEAGVVAGRGVSLVLTQKEISKSEVVVVWGRNIDTTNSHMMNTLKDKTLIVIDPVKTKIASMADFHIQIEPKNDIYLAMLLARFIHMQELSDYEFIEKRSKEYDYFLDLINSYGINFLIKKVDIKASEINALVDLLTTKKVSFLVGVGVQKYDIGHSILHMIDSLASMLALFGKEGCGVSYLANSSYGYKLPFKKSKDTTPIVNVDFSKYDLAFIQGANPANQMPSSKRVIESLKECGFVIYFGLYENETSKLANLVIPAKSFLAKSDLRLSYGHEYLGDMPKLIEEDIGISEYDLSSYLLSEFGYEELLSEKEIIESIKNSNSKVEGEYLRSSSYDENAYSQKFYTDDEKFIFIDELEIEENEQEGYYLITSKSKHSLNSQFKRDSRIHLPPSMGFLDKEIVIASSIYGSHSFEVKVDDRLRDDSVLIYSGAKGVNFLTPDKLSDEGEGAIYQDVRVVLERLNP